MKKITIIIMLPILIIIMGNAQAQTIVNSLNELRTAVLNSNQQLILTPGQYNFEDLPNGSRDITISGSNNTITLTGVHIIVPVGSVSQNYINVSGNDNIIINGEVEDVYRSGITEITDFSAYNADRTNLAKGLGGDPVLKIIGSRNLLDGMKLTVRGSFPYGYGSMYGIGSENVFGLNKRCGILINGVGNTIDNVEVQQRAFGHAIFMQNDADQTVIKNTLVEGRVRNTAELYTETNSFDLPNLTNYLMPYEDRAIPTNEYHSLCEDGIRMYNIPGSITVENCTVKKMRGGIRLYLGGTAKVTNSTAIDCGLTNYNTQTNGEIINSSGNFAYTSLLNYRLSRRSTNVELTIIPSPNATGPHNIADITGNDNTITFHRTPGPLDETERAIVITSDNNTIVNETEYPIILESTANGNNITSCGTVTDNGSGNTITLSDCNFAISCLNTPENLQAECFNNMYDIAIRDIAGNNNNEEVYGIHAGDWISFNDIDLTDMNAVSVVASSIYNDVGIEIREGSTTGTLLATVPITSTTSNSIYQEFSANLNQAVNGLTDLYFVFTSVSETGWLFNLDKMSFKNDPCINASLNPIFPIEAETFCDSSGINVEQLSTFNQTIGSIDNGDYLYFPNVDFGTNHNYNSLQVYASSNTLGGTVKIRDGAVNGALLASVTVANTGGWLNYETVSNRIDNPITGAHDIYIVFSGSSGSLLNIDRLRFHEDRCGNITDAYSEIDALDFCESFEVTPINNEYLGGLHDGDWIRFGSVDFTSESPAQVTLRLAGLNSTDGFVNIMLDNPETGTLIANATVPKTGAWTNWEEVTVTLNQEVTGIHNVYVYFGNTSFNIDWFKFHQVVSGPCDDTEVKNASMIEAEDFCSMSGIQIDGSGIGYIHNGDWTMYKNYDLTNMNSMQVSAASRGSGGNIEIRLGSVSGTLIGTVPIAVNGSWTNWIQTQSDITTTSGVHDIYLVFTGASGYLFNLNWIAFENTLSVNDFSLNQIKFYPNPTRNEITISNAAGSSIEIYNISGALETKFTVTNTKKTISIDNLKSGVHFLKFKNEQGTLVKKLIKL